MARWYCAERCHTASWHLRNNVYSCLKFVYCYGNAVDKLNKENNTCRGYRECLLVEPWACSRCRYLKSLTIGYQRITSWHTQSKKGIKDNSKGDLQKHCKLLGKWDMQWLLMSWNHVHESLLQHFSLNGCFLHFTHKSLFYTALCLGNETYCDC